MRNKPHRSGFTLVELLVVIAIIGVLISLLLPSLTGARDTARKITCMARLRTMGTHVESYRNDYRMWYTVNSTYGTTPSNINSAQYYDGSFETLVRPYTSTNLTWLGYTNPKSIQPAVNPYICVDTVPHASYAPATVRQQGWIEGTGSVYGNYRINSYFGYGSATDADNKINRRCKREVGINPALLGMIVEWKGTSIAFGDYGNTTGTAYRHGNVANLLFADGHGKSYKSLPEGVTSGEIKLQQ